MYLKLWIDPADPDIAATNLKTNYQHETTELSDSTFTSKMPVTWAVIRRGDIINVDNTDNCGRAVVEQSRISSAVSMVTAGSIFTYQRPAFDIMPYVVNPWS